jgi:hypothetical protein
MREILEMLAVRPILCSARRAPPPPPARVVVATAPREPTEEHAIDRIELALGLDRRGGRRRTQDPPSRDPFTAATHRALPLVFAVGSAGRWALVKGLSIGPHGVLVHLLDATDRELDPRDRVGAAVWMRLARHAHPIRPPSPLWLSSCCVEAPALIAELARAASGPHPRARRVELVALSWLGEPAVAPRELPRSSCVGMLAPLCDPGPRVLGIGLADSDLARLTALMAARFTLLAAVPATSPPGDLPVAATEPVAPEASTTRRRRAGRRRGKPAAPIP